MQTHELEAWVLSIVEGVKSARPVEDFRVELKAEWPSDYNRAARRLAGHCNAAHGEPILWVVGLDEERGVSGADRCEVPAWLGQVGKHFDGIPPELVRDLNVPVGESTVVALLFSTDRAPFVVKNAVKGPVHREVPWREGTGVRSAKREDLLRLLSPLQRLPEVEVREAILRYRKNKQSGDEWRLEVRFYVVPKSSDLLVIPFHRCEARFSVEPSIEAAVLNHMTMHPPSHALAHVALLTRVYSNEAASLTVESTGQEVLIRGPGLVVLNAVAAEDVSQDTSPRELWKSERRASFSVSMQPAGMQGAVTLAGTLFPDKQSLDSVSWRSRSAGSAQDGAAMQTPGKR